MKAGLERRSRFALGGLTVAVASWVGAPWLFCSETWASEPERRVEAKCTAPVGAEDLRAKPRTPRESTPPLAPLIA
jgi:hypothetical protein